MNNDDFSTVAPPSQTTAPPAPAPTPAGRLRYFGWGMAIGCLLPLVWILLLVGGCCSLIVGSIAEVASSDRPAERPITSRTVVEGSGSRSIAKINVRGVISLTAPRSFTADDGSTASAERICKAIRKAQDDSGIAAVILDMNTPGGEVVASDEIRKAVDACRKAGKPVVTCIRTLGASGGYFIAAGSDWIVANRMATTGSIGVIISGLQAHGLMEKIGVKPMVYRSGKFKDIMNPMREPTAEERAYMEELVERTFNEFCQVIADGRPRHFADAEAVRNALFADGRPLCGADALKYGLIDELGGFDAAVAVARKLGEVPDAPVIEVKGGSGFLDGILSSLGRQPSLKIEGLPATGSAAMHPGMMYFLMPEAL